MTIVYQHPTAGQIIIGANKGASRRVPKPAGIAPGAAGSIPDQVITQGAGSVQIAVAGYFTGTALTFALQAAVTGVSLAGSTLTISDASVLAAATVTVVASSAFGPSATQTFSRTVNAPAAGGTITINPFVRDEVVFDLGTSVGDPEAQVPLSGTAGPGEVIQARAVSLDDFGLTSTAWRDVATANGVGNWSGALAFTSISNSRFSAEVRLKAAPATTATGTRTFCVGHVAIDIGQSERYRVREVYFSQTTSPEAIIGIAEAVQQLAAPYRVGRVTPTAQQPFTVGVDTLPTGLTRSGNQVTVNKSTYDGAPLQHWYFPDHRLEMGDSRFVMRRCKMEVVSDLTLPYFLNNLNGGGFKLIAHNDFVAKPGGLSFSAFMKEEYSGTGLNLVVPDMNWMIRNFFSGSTGDLIKAGRGYYMENTFEWTWNIPGNPAAWAAGTTYAAGDFVKYNNNYFRSELSGNLGNTPPSGQTDSTYWKSWNPHSDGFNPQHGVSGPLVIARNLIKADFARTAGNLLDGANNVLYRGNRDPAHLANNNRMDLVLVEENVVVRAPTSTSYAIQTEGGANVVPPVIRGNRITPGASGNQGFIHAGTIQPGTEWTDNRRLTDESLIALPTNCVAGTYTPSTEKAVQFASHDDATINAVAYVNTAHRPTAGVAAMANGFISEFPGRRFAVGSATKSGTTLSWLCDDNATARQMAHYIAFVDHLCPHGTQPGTITHYWQAGDQALGNNYADNILPMLTGKYLDGSPVTLPANLGQRTINRTLAERHAPWTRTRILLCGPGTRCPESTSGVANNMANADKKTDNSQLASMVNYQRIRAEYRIMVAAVGGQAVHPFVGVQPLAPYMAYADGVHPSDHVDGLPTMGRYIALESLQGLGLIPDLKVTFDQSAFAANGSYAEFWSSAGPVTTARRKRGLAAIPATWPHRTEVFSWEIGDTQAAAVPAQSATIQAGRVRVLPISGAFANGQKFAFGRGGASGVMRPVEDSADRYDLNYPGVDLGFYKLDIVPIDPMPTAPILTAAGIT
jgi:hypothetical protein